MGNGTLIGIDIAKHVVHVLGVDAKGKEVFRKKVQRADVLQEFAKFSRCAVRMEACGGAHYWGRELGALGFEVKLIPAQFVKPYVRTNKNDWADALAICEAAVRPDMRFVEVKTTAQQELQHLHRVRERVMKHCTALNNEIRGILLEYGIAIARGKPALRDVPERIEHYGERISAPARRLIGELLDEYREHAARAAKLGKQLEAYAKEHPVCQRLVTIPGVAAIIATGIVASAPAATSFKNGRCFAAWLGLVPKQHSSGDKQRLLGISKRGDPYLRKQLVHGARSVLYRAHLKRDPLSTWAHAIKEKRGWNKAAVAVANKNARIIWALMRYETEFNPKAAAAVA